MWPLQKDMDLFYGNPRGIKNPSVVNPMWSVDNLTFATPPFIMRYDGKPVKRFQCHKKVKDSLEGVLHSLWEMAHEKQETVDAWGLATFGGCFNYRLKRGQTSLSTHAYGAALDLDPENNAFHSEKFRFTPDSPVVQAFKAAGWEWGGDWSSPDAMHFQAARVR